MKVLIDNGHGENTQGKCSPDGRLKEWAWTREVARMVMNDLKKRGVDAELLVREDLDVSLSARVARVNDVCEEVGTKNVIVVSIHVNAAGASGRWHSARGWCGFVAPNASAKSKRLALALYEAAEARGLRGNRAVPVGKVWEQNLAICRDTKCAAVLTENLFMDNKEDVQILLSAEGKRVCADVHVEGIMKFLG
jgi:N-acetylmuramoyl-L-alanine amidase